MPTIHTIYTGELRTEAKHLASGNILITDAPIDNQGKGETFSPTDLLAASLGSCMLTVMGIAANARQINIDGTRVTITKIMAADPRRVIEIKAEIEMPDVEYTQQQKDLLESTAINCPVAKSLHSDLKQYITFKYKR